MHLLLKIVYESEPKNPRLMQSLLHFSVHAARTFAFYLHHHHLFALNIDSIMFICRIKHAESAEVCVDSQTFPNVNYTFSEVSAAQL